MKNKFIVLSAIICALLLILLPACDAQNAGSLKSITRPYIAQYECTEATFGGDNILDKFDYIEVNLLDKEKIQLIFKIKNSEKRVTDGKYTFDPKTHELSADIGVFGVRFKQSTTVKNGKFTVSKAIGRKQLILKFKSK